MKKYFWILLVIFLFLAIGAFFIFNNRNSNSNYNTSRISTNSNQTNTKNNSNLDIQNSEDTTNVINSEDSNNTTNEQAIPEVPQPPKEEELTNFSTKIYTKEASRQHNMELTCSRLNDITVANNTTFSFCNTLGSSTSDKGYEKADIFDKNGNKQKGYGGGNCQVSTTLYNAVLQVPGLDVVERHEHSNKVPYIQTGKDAAVAYGSYDFKFTNNTGFDIKISTEVTADYVKISLIKLS